MAADSQMTFGDMSKGRVKKIQRLADGSLLACAGEVKVIRKVQAWAEAGFPADKRPRLRSDAVLEGLLIQPDGAICYFDDSLEMDKLEDKFYAIGTGGQYALGAMACRRSAVAAVKIAAMFDAQTSAPIETMTLDQSP